MKNDVKENLTEKQNRTFTQSFLELQKLDKITSKYDIEKLDSLIEKIIEYLPGPVTPEILRNLDYSIYINWNQFAANEYSSLLDLVINLFDTSWPIQQTDTALKLNHNILRLFSIDYNAEFVSKSMSTMLAAKYENKFLVLAQILERCLLNDTWIFSGIIHFCTHTEKGDNHQSALNESRQEEFINLLLGIPNKVANRLKGKTTDLFIPKNYSCLLLLAFLKAVHFITESNANEKTKLFHTGFLSKLLSRILIDFNFQRSSDVLPKVFDVLYEWARFQKYKPAVQDILSNLQRNSIDVASFYVLQKEDVNQIIGDAVNISNAWKFCLLTKLPLMNFLNSDKLIINLIYYLSTRTTLECELYQLLAELLQSWSSKASINTHTIDQHLYITKLILASVELFKIKNMNADVSKIRKIIFNGVQNHIESMNGAVRIIGMFTAETVINKFLNVNMKTEDELHFDYNNISAEEKLILVELKDFLVNIFAEKGSITHTDTNVIIEQLQYSVDHNLDYTNKIHQVPVALVEALALPNMNTTMITTPKSNNIHGLDSDDDDEDDEVDDLKPYDMSNDISMKLEKVPRYLSDLKDFLLETDDPDVFESCMDSCVDLIREKLPNDDVSVGLGLLQLFIGLEQKFYLEGFEEKRLAGCIAICCVYPKQCAEYLCREFHTDIGRYSVSRKLCMLDILCETAKSLSEFDTNKIEEKAKVQVVQPSGKKLALMKDEKKNVMEAKLIIRKRIEEKTKRFTSRPRYLHTQANKFSDVAGHFFFPLLYGLEKQQFSKLQNDIDNVLLIKFLHTISTVMLSAKNCPIATKFATEIFQISSVFRFHPEPTVRLAVLQMIATVFMVIPKNLLILHDYHYLHEIRIWLEEYLSFNIIKSEKNAECRELAKHVLVLCIDALIDGN